MGGLGAPTQDSWLLLNFRVFKFFILFLTDLDSVIGQCVTIFQLFSSGGNEGPLLHSAVRQCTAILQLLSGEGVWWAPPPPTDVPTGVSLDDDLDLLR